MGGLGKAWLKSSIGRAITGVALLLASSCTGTRNEITGSAGNIRITPGSTLTIDLQDVLALGESDFNLSLKTVSEDFRSMSEFYNLTPDAMKALSEGKTAFTFVIPKSFGANPPFAIVADIPEVQDYLMDIIQDGQNVARPGIAGRLAFDLLDSFYTPFTPKKLTEYSASDFSGIKSLIQNRITQLGAQSEYLSLGAIPYDRLMRFFRNALAFNPAFLIAVRTHGVDFDFTTAPVPGVTADRSPENDLSACQRGFCYEYARNFRVRRPDTSSEVAPNAPFRHNSNNPAMIAPGAQPAPSLTLSSNERTWQIGSPVAIRVRARTFDLEQDHVERNFLYKYTPRRLPPSRTSMVGFPFKPEPQPEPLTPISLGAPDAEDVYVKESIDFNEALDYRNYPDCLADQSLCDTAYREVYYLVTDGMAWVPYHWKYAYADANRPPKFIRDEAGNINDTHFDGALQSIFNDPTIPGTNGWKQHNSHCENDPDATSPNSCVGGPGVCPTTVNFYTRITSKDNGPWSCAFKFYDPDLRDDPNGAPDQLHVEIGADPFAMINAGGQVNASNQITDMLLAWPPLSPYTTEAPRRVAAISILSNCGAEYGPCAAALSQVEIDNAVKNASESQANQSYGYQIKIYDRLEGGLSEMQNVSRMVQFLPKPPLLVNYATPSPAPGTVSLSADIVLDPTDNKYIHFRTETFFDEIKESARPYSTTASYEDIGLPGILLGPANRSKFNPSDLNGQNSPISSYITQPHTLCNSGSPTDDGTQCRGTFGVSMSGLDATSGSPGVPVLMGSSLRFLDASLYDTPRVFDSTCSLAENNSGLTAGNDLAWDQRPVSSGYLAGWSQLPGGALPAARSDPTFGGWTFEINAIDYDNLNLRSGEPSDPVFFSALVDGAMAGRILFCHPTLPNLDARYGETYIATNAALTNQKDPDVCIAWSPTPPVRMQPMPVYYQGKTSTGAPITRKLVYHRLRVAIRPTDQGQDGKLDDQDPPGIIRNFLRNVRLNGNVYAQKGDTRDRTEPFHPVTFERTPISISSRRHEMLSCLRSAGGAFSAPTTSSLNTILTQVPVTTFGVADQDQVHDGNTSLDGFLTGNAEVDLALAGTPRNLFDPEVVKFVPFLQDCTSRDGSIPAFAKLTYRWKTVNGAPHYTVYYRKAETVPGPWINGGTVAQNSFTLSGPTGPGAYEVYEFKNVANLGSGPVDSAVIRLQANPTPPPAPSATPAFPPAIWYSSDVSGAQPQIRLSGSYVGTPGAQVCIRPYALPLSNSGQLPYDTVWKISRADPLSSAPLTLQSAFLKSCTGYDSITLRPHQQHLLVAAVSSNPPLNPHSPQTCAVPLSTALTDNPFTIDGNAGIVARAISRIDPTQPDYGALSPTPLVSAYRLDWFPSIYGKWSSALPNLNASNGLYFFLRPMNSFQLDLDPTSFTYGRTSHVSAKVGIGASLPATPTNLGRLPAVPAAGYHYGANMTHLDTNPLKMSLLTPAAAPSTSPPYWYRLVEGGTKIQAYSFAPPSGTKTISLGITAFDQDLADRPESDPYDVYQFGLALPTPNNPIAPLNIPQLVGLSRPDCSSLPPGYPTTLSTLRRDTLTPYRTCSIDWTQTAGDAGRTFKYTINAQDNPGANPPTLGIGGVNITGNPRNGLPVPFKLELISLETNQKPYFTATSGGAALTSLYPAGAGWSSVFPSGTPSVVPACIPGSTGGCVPLSLSADDFLADPNARLVTETSNSAVKETITVYAKDDATEPKLKTLNALKPTSVYVIDGPYAGKTVQVRSFNDPTRFIFNPPSNQVGALTIKMEWAPSDYDAAMLSNPGGFLIPIVVRDTAWDPSGGESGFPNEFKVPQMSRTNWVWVKLSVLNQTPELSYLDGALWKPLMGATLQFQTGSNTPIRIQARDFDVSRYLLGNASERALGFYQSTNPAASDYFFPASNPAFLGFQNIAVPSPSPNISTFNGVVQEFQLTALPDNSHLGTHQVSVVLRDPGDPSLGLAVSGDGAVPPRAQVPAFPVSFSVNVVGRPIFLAPAPSPNPSGIRTAVQSYYNKDFYYPLSLSVSRPTEKTASNSTKNFFMGVLIKGAPTPAPGMMPVPTPSNANDGGFFVNQNYVLRARANTFSASSNPLPPADRRYSLNIEQSRIITVGAINLSKCALTGSVSGNAAYTRALVRIIENPSPSLPTLQYCYITAANAASDLSTVEVQHTLKSDLMITPPMALANAEIERVTSANLGNIPALNQEWLDFSGRCGGTYCAAPLVVNGIQLNGDLTLMNASEGEYRSFGGAGYEATFKIQQNVARKIFKDTQAGQASRKLDVTALKDENLNFKISLANPPDPNLPPLQARWYVNGCLKSVQAASTQDLSFTYKVPVTGSGLNNDCSGQYDRGTPVAVESPDDLGMLRVRLALVRGFEPTTLNADEANFIVPGAPINPSGAGYAFNVRVINSNPIAQLQDSSISPRSARVQLPGSSGPRLIQFFNTSSRNYVAYTDTAGTNGVIRFRTLSKTGALNTGPLNVNPFVDLSCPGFPANSVLWMGIEPSGGTASVAMNNSYANKGDTLLNAFPSSTDPAYTSVAKTCFRSGLNLSAGTTITATNASVADDAAKAFTTASLSFSPRVSASYVSGSIRYLIDGIHASFSPWGSNPYSSANARIFASTPAPLTGAYANNEVIKTIVSGNRLIQVIGANETKATLYRSHLMISTVSENGSGGLTGVPTFHDLTSLCGSNPSDHPLTAYPVDAAYIPAGAPAAADTLFVLMTDLDGSAPKGRLFEILNATGINGSASCRLVSANLMVPNRSRDVYNPLHRRMVVDTYNGLVWGIITNQNGQPGMVYSYDYVSRRDPKSQILSFTPHSLVYFSGASGGANSVHILNSADRSLYRIW